MASAVKIEASSHEFSTLPGLKEDITDVIRSNLKGIVCCFTRELDEVQVRLVKDKPGKVVAADIDVPAELEVLEPRSLHRLAVRQRRRRDDAHHQARHRLCVGCRSQDRRDGHRRHADRLDLQPYQACLLHRRERSRGPAHRLRVPILDVVTQMAPSRPKRRCARPPTSSSTGWTISNCIPTASSRRRVSHRGPRGGGRRRHGRRAY